MPPVDRRCRRANRGIILEVCVAPIPHRQHLRRCDHPITQIPELEYWIRGPRIGPTFLPICCVLLLHVFFSLPCQGVLFFQRVGLFATAAICTCMCGPLTKHPERTATAIVRRNLACGPYRRFWSNGDDDVTAAEEEDGEEEESSACLLMTIFVRCRLRHGRRQRLLVPDGMVLHCSIAAIKEKGSDLDKHQHQETSDFGQLRRKRGD